MATDLSRRIAAETAVINPRTRFVDLAANAAPGTAEDLQTDLLAAGVAISSASGILISNRSGADAWVRGAAAGAGTGVEIPDTQSRYFGWDEPGTGVVFLENAAALSVAVFFP